jgi:hypothetical protein
MKDSCIIDWELHQKVMAKKNKNTITICTGVGLNMLFPEYVTIEIPNKKNTIITDWLEEHGDPKIEKEVVKSLQKIERKRKTKKNGDI